MATRRQAGLYTVELYTAWNYFKSRCIHEIFIPKFNFTHFFKELWHILRKIIRAGKSDNIYLVRNDSILVLVFQSECSTIHLQMTSVNKSILSQEVDAWVWMFKMN